MSDSSKKLIETYLRLASIGVGAYLIAKGMDEEDKNKKYMEVGVGATLIGIGTISPYPLWDYREWKI